MTLKKSKETKLKMRIAHLGKKYKPMSKKGRKNISKALLGKHKSDEARKKMSLARKNEKHWAWKGDNAGYRSKHHWMEKNYGKPTTCEHCQTGNLTGHKIHWANISGEHKRDRTDWLRLCVKCHKLFDKHKKYANLKK